jgi:hypothetical protein
MTPVVTATITLSQAGASCAKPLNARLRDRWFETCLRGIHIVGNPLIIYALNVHHNVGMGRKSLKEHGLPLSSSAFSTRFSTGMRILQSAKQGTTPNPNLNRKVIPNDYRHRAASACRKLRGEEKGRHRLGGPKQKLGTGAIAAWWWTRLASQLREL